MMCSRLWGCGDLEVLFGGHIQVPTPWPSAPRRKHRPLFDTAALSTLLDQPVDLADVDPRLLHASQPWVLRHHVAYYGTGEWERTGRTSADRHVELNQYPVVVPDHRGRTVIVSGHHRATAALVAGVPLRVRIAARTRRAAVTPLLFVDPATAVDVPQATIAIESGRPASVRCTEDAAEVLGGLGLGADEVRQRLSRVRPTPAATAWYEEQA